MAVRSNLDLMDELKHYGVQDALKCYQCGNCSAVCHASENPHVFPRKTMHQLQLGLEESLESSLDPWLCYYCGECTAECPRGAEPGETMMSLRRWLTAKYDFTGISRLLYRSAWSEAASVLLLALLTGVGFSFYGLKRGGGNVAVYDGAHAFLPAHAVHIFDWTMGVVLALLLGINCARMWWFSMRGVKSVPLRIYARHLLELPLHFFTQKRMRACEDRRPWVLHLWLMLSYVTMLVLIMFFLKQMQAGPEINWMVHGFGYLSAAGLVVCSALMLRGRIRKDAVWHHHSHFSDWIFLGLLFYVSLTGVLQHLLHRVGMPVGANVIYVAHLMGVVPMLVLEVPFSKWSHMAYRPLAIYLTRVRDAALAESGRLQAVAEVEVVGKAVGVR